MDIQPGGQLQPTPEADQSPELSVVLPCLDEAETLAICLRKASQSASSLGVAVELIVADNGSTDGSQEIARANGARVIDVETRGYGAALAAGISAARGTFVIMADADDSYALDDLGPFIEELRGGADLVMGNRFAGTIEPGAMPFIHRYLGNPVLSFIGRTMFHTPVGDFHCGMRGFRRDAIAQLDLRTIGMEFASEMVVKASVGQLDIREVPTTLRPDGRTRPPHLRTWRDGWRHLRFLLLMSPRWLLLIPGLFLSAIGAIGMAILLQGPISVGDLEFDIHALVYSHLALVIGLQTVFLAVFVRAYATTVALLPPAEASSKWLNRMRLEHGLIAGLLLIIGGLVGSIAAVASWGSTSFEGLDPSDTMRIVIPSVTAVAIGAELVVASFVLGVLKLEHR
ncbi:MAG: glycosyltransferase family 2 protein [Ilumatobacteraceae bacterium]|nr:glycosyltransferase family 2 protein [Ilumatobacteraceae bacterium]